jgi:hypothetical protein
MPRNGSGTYTKQGSDFANGATADAPAVNAQIDDIATALTASVAKDGQTAMTGNLAMGSNKLTGLAAGSTAGDSIRYEQVFGADPIALTNVTIGGIKQHAYDWWIVALSDETTSLTSGAGKVSFHAPYAATVANVYAGVTVAGTAGTLQFDINEDGTTILSTKITIDNNEKHSSTAAVAPTISDASIAAFALLSFDVDSVGATGILGAKIYMKVSPT